MTSPVVGTAAVFLRPLRYLGDVEATISIVPTAEKELPLSTVHVHITIVSKKQNEENEEDHDTSQQEAELFACTGQWITLRIRVQPRNIHPSCPPYQVQYQLTPATESFCFMLDHTNTTNVLVTHDFIAHISQHMLQFNLLPAASEASAHDDAKSTASVHEDAKDHEWKAMIASQLAATQAAIEAKVHDTTTAMTHEYAKRLEAKEKELEDLTKQREKDRQAHEQAIQKEVAMQKQLLQVADQLEVQLRDRDQWMDTTHIQHLQTNDALEALKQRMAADAKERDELNRRIRTLEEEKNALLLQQATPNSPSRVCILQ